MKRILVRLLLLAALLVLICFFFLSTFGFPDWLTAKVRDQMNKGGYTVEIGWMRLYGLRSVMMHDVRAYRKGIIGPPLLDAARVAAKIDLWALLKRETCIAFLKISRGEVRPGMAGEKGGRRGTRLTVKKTRIKLEAEDCVVHGVVVKRMACSVRSDGRVMELRDIDAALNREDMHGELTGNVTYDTVSRVLEGHATARFDPHLLLPLIEARNMPATARLIRRFDFRGVAPRCVVFFRKPLTGDRTVKADAGFWFEDCRYRGVDLLRADGRMHIDLCETDSVASLDPLLIVRKEGIVRGGLTVDMNRKTVEFDGVSAIDPRALARMMGATTNGLLETLRFDGPVRIAAAGIVDYEDMAQTDFEATVEGRDVGRGGLVADRCFFSVRAQGVTNVFTDIRGKICEGGFAGAATLVLPYGDQTDTWYRVKGNMRDVAFERLVAAVAKSGDRDYDGRLSGRVEVRGFAGKGNGQTARGQGSIAIRDGRVFLLPVFGGLSTKLAKVIPGLDFVLRQTDARASFKIKEGKIHADRADIKGDILSLLGQGDYYFDGDLDFSVQLTFLKSHTIGSKLLRIPTYLLSKLFECRLEGSLADPRWSFFNFQLGPAGKEEKLESKQPKSDSADSVPGKAPPEMP